MKRRQTGISYIEVLVASALIALVLVPAMEGIPTGIQGSEIHKQRAEMHYVLYGKLEQVLAEPFDDLDAAGSAAGDFQVPTSYSDLGASVPHEVFIWRWDVDNADTDDDGFTGGEDDILWLRVATADGLTELQTLISRY